MGPSESVISGGGVVNPAGTGARIPAGHMQGLIVFPFAIFFFRDVNFAVARPVSSRGTETPCSRPITFAGVRKFAPDLKIRPGAKRMFALVLDPHQIPSSI